MCKVWNEKDNIRIIESTSFLFLAVVGIVVIVGGFVGRIL